jgi:hypothetical protein
VSTPTQPPDLMPDVLPAAPRMAQYTTIPGEDGVYRGSRLTADPAASRQSPMSSMSRRISQAPGKIAIPAQRYALSKYLADAIVNARAMEEAACDGNLLDLATSGVSLVQNLDNLWRLRHLRDDDWISIVNFLQGMVTRVELESLAHEQCTALRLVIESHLTPNVDASDVQAAIALLSKAGFNPWRAISEK